MIKGYVITLPIKIRKFLINRILSFLCVESHTLGGMVWCGYTQKGEVVKAYVVLNSEQGTHITAQDIIDWAKQKMTSYKSPRYVEFRESLPATGAGKVLRRLLSEQKS